MSTEHTPKKPASASASGSDSYEARLAEWCAKHSVRHPDEGEPVEIFIEPKSEMDDVLQEPEIKGERVILSDLYGWAMSYRLADLRAHVAKHGKLSTWDDFAKLGDLDGKDVADGDE